jgi:hypothetical protein
MATRTRKRHTQPQLDLVPPPLQKRGLDYPRNDEAMRYYMLRALNRGDIHGAQYWAYQGAKFTNCLYTEVVLAARIG